MQPKMERFLKSIGIEDPSAFDLDFDLVARNSHDRNVVDMIILKKNPWEYPQLEEFQNGLNTINYQYTLSFSYRNEPTVYDAIKLFNDWYHTHVRFIIDAEIVPASDTIKFIFKDEKSEAKTLQLLDDFVCLLDFLNYRFKVTHEVKHEESVGPIVSSKQLQKIESKVEDVIEEHQEEYQENDQSYYVDKEEIDEQKAEEEKEEVEETYLKIMKANLRSMQKERRLKDAWKNNGGYIHVENWDEITTDIQRVDINGELFGLNDPRTGRNGKLNMSCGLGSGKNAIGLRIIENESVDANMIGSLKKGINVRVRGRVDTDRFSNQIIIRVHKIDLLPPPPLRDDKEKEKRVELHLHTRMSAMDSVGDIEKYCELAAHMGHKAIAITDHGVVQGYPEAQKAGKEFGLKILYGSEFYMVNDELPFVLNPSERELHDASYVVFDLETTGLSIKYDRIMEFGAVRYEKGRIVETLDLLINPGIPIPKKIQNLTKITEDMVKNKPCVEDLMQRMLDFIGDSILVSHNIVFDVGFMNETLRRMGQKPLANPAIDTLSLSRYLFPEARKHSLGTLSRNLGLASYNEDEAHRADFDAKILGEVWYAILNKLIYKNFHIKHSALAELKTNKAMLKHLHPSHICALAKNKAGLNALYQLVSLSHIQYITDIPRTPKREITRLRENLLLGSACFNGDVFETARTRSKATLKEVISYYDYIEVQPLANYSYLVNTNAVNSYDDIKKYIKDIIEIADELNIPVVATGDAHYVNPEDKITRDVIISAPAVGGKPHPLSINKYLDENGNHFANPDQHYRSTKEMLDAFEFLGKEKAFEIVVTNTNKIADMIEPLAPVQKVLHKPEIENSDKMLTEECFKKAKSMYGDPLPKFIEDRLNRELNGINSNGYSVTYYIANRIIAKAHEDGYLIGSRGSVGSSLAATMYGITEVNPLPPHYYCPKCAHFELADSKIYHSGYDLPDKVCPVCGAKMKGDGQNIPFETFLGFNADKIPDIDLNFPSDYQQRAFDYTKVVFGEHNVFRAGTVETVQDKTAFGYVRGYYERLGIDPDSVSRTLIAYIASKVTGTKRTTGQHPGGIMVLPRGEDIYDFSPVQFPADDLDSTWYTTHFDYRALHDSLLKLDLLGHVDPLALKMMLELTGLKVEDIPMNDKKVLSIFTSTRALGMKSNHNKAVIGALAIPEFGTVTGLSILDDAHPTTFADLVIISALAHGRGVWKGNSQDLIQSKQCTLQDVIGCRDDIMTYLVSKGLPNKVSFSIMEDVRHGKKLKPEFEEMMRAYNVPEWYIDSCNKIEYMFPKAHAVAYVTNAVRVGFFKVYYPLEFYAVWFSVRSKAWEIKTLLGGIDTIVARYDELNRLKSDRSHKISPKEEAILQSLTIAIEMEERGFTFSNIDLYKSEATQFVCDHEHNCLIPPFTVLDGLGDAAAETVVEARKDGEFTSQENLLARTKLNNTNVQDLVELGALDGLGESEQMSLFEFGLEMDD